MTKLEAGKVTFTINDKASIHNFSLDGPKGFEKTLTTVPFKGTKTVTLTLKAGKYKFYCEPHESTWPATSPSSSADARAERQAVARSGASLPERRRFSILVVPMHETTIAERALRPGVVAGTLGVTARRLGARHPAHARDGRRPRHRSRLGRLVPRHLGDDDGGDDAAVGDADGAALLEGSVQSSRRPALATALFLTGT